MSYGISSATLLDATGLDPSRRRQRLSERRARLFAVGAGEVQTVVGDDRETVVAEALLRDAAVGFVERRVASGASS